MKKGRAVGTMTSVLRSDVEWALEKGLGPRDLVPMLERLRTHAPDGSAAACFADLELAEVVLSTSPWRSAQALRAVLSACWPMDTDRTWAALFGLLLALLEATTGKLRGGFEKATQSYLPSRVFFLCSQPGAHSRRGSRKDRRSVALARPGSSRTTGKTRKLAASYAHALVRLGREPEARRVLERALGPDSETTALLLGRWATKSDDSVGP